MSVIEEIQQLRLKFLSGFHYLPDIVVLTDEAWDEVCEIRRLQFDGYRLLGMDVELGDKVECKFTPKVIIDG